MLNDLQTPIEQEEETEEDCLEDEMPRNIEVDIDEDTINIFQGLLNEARTSQPSATPTPSRRTQSRLLELECYIGANGRIPMTIASASKNPISPNVVRFSQAIDMCVRKTFSVRCLKHFKNYSNPEEAHANPPHILVGRDKDWHYLCNHYMNRTFQKQSWTNKATRQKQPYNHSSGLKSFLQRQHELAEQRGKSIDRVELFRKTHVQDGTLNQMLELQSQPTPKGTQPLPENEICQTVLGRRPGYSKDLGWEPKPKAQKTASASSSTTSCSQSTVELQLRAALDQAMQQIEEHTRNYDVLAS
ncbi:CACTA en-spm transposon protein [Cucumis melo var. makuwa]|uniref:CACTA en-spm transposon protein n=1 Tax=Cucumis melo var. makuwa TaxID=1194695 RepID=A0A5A7U7E8_CUCMM|nr:CACTA en-spm transposon protein [Cucumis melo var. makuwa]